MLLISFAVNSAHSNEIEEPKEYRQNNYRAEVPAKVTGASVINTPKELKAFINKYKPLLLDVYPAARKPDNLPDSELWIEPSRQSLPGTVWLANVGLGTLTYSLEAHFSNTLARLTSHDSDYPVVIFCEPACWHSWNATKRAVSAGYTNVHWYKAGVSGWREAGLPLETYAPLRPTP